MSSNDSTTNTAHAHPSSRVAQALQIYRSINACNAHIARGHNVHALTAALMLPCYQSAFRTLALSLTAVEEIELRHALHTLHEPETAIEQ